MAQGFFGRIFEAVTDFIQETFRSEPKGEPSRNEVEEFIQDRIPDAREPAAPYQQESGGGGRDYSVGDFYADNYERAYELFPPDLTDGQTAAALEIIDKQLFEGWEWDDILDAMYEDFWDWFDSEYSED